MRRGNLSRREREYFKDSVSEADERGVRDSLSTSTVAVPGEAETILHLADLDVQHRRINQLLDQLRAGISSGAPHGRLRKALEGVREYLAVHFDDEEQFMAKLSYPAERLAMHIAAHVEMLEQAEIINRCVGVADSAEPLSALDLLSSRLQTHVIAHDQPYLDFAVAKRIE